MTKKHYELCLPYFKRGDDLGAIHRHLQNSEEVFKTSTVFEEHAKMMDRAAEILRKMARHADEGKVDISQTDTHFISVECEEKLGEILCMEGILDRSIFKEDEVEWNEEECPQE